MCTDCTDVFLKSKHSNVASDISAPWPHKHPARLRITEHQPNKTRNWAGENKRKQESVQQFKLYKHTSVKTKNRTNKQKKKKHVQVHVALPNTPSSFPRSWKGLEAPTEEPFVTQTRRQNDRADL